MRHRTTRLRLIAVLVGVLMGVSAPALADLRVETEITYTVDIEEGRLHLKSDLTLTNLTPDERDGNQIFQYFYDSLQIYVPDTLENLQVTADGRDLGYSLRESEEVEGALIADIKTGSAALLQPAHGSHHRVRHPR